MAILRNSRTWAVLCGLLTIPAALAQEDRARLLPPVDSPPAAVVVPAEPAKAGECIDCQQANAAFDWSKIPVVRPTPRLGGFYVPPTGPGYYSLRDLLAGQERQAPPKFPYVPTALMAGSMFDADFRYLDSPDNKQTDLLDALHRIRLGENWMFSTGGQTQIRQMHEINSRLSGVNQDYQLYRTRVYTDLWYRDRARVFVEFIDAHIFNETLAPLPIDQNRSDLLNAFVDLKIFDVDGHPAYVRVGRQEMVLGSQRLTSPLEWANTRRTFEGVRALYTGEKWDFDLFGVRPVIISPSHFDDRDNNQAFMGAWATYRPVKGTSLDLYYLHLANDNPKVQQGLVLAPFHVHTFGTRFAGDKEHWLWDVEGMFQVGDRGPADIATGAYSVGGGRNFAKLPMNPTLWLYYDYATGDDSPNTGQFNTFNPLFPFGHYYFGFLDLVSRQNLHDVNLSFFLNPTKWIQLNIQGHMFRLDEDRDALYNAATNAIRRSPRGTAGNNIGNEIDLLANFHLSAHSDVLLGYSKLFAGDFIRNTGNGRSPELFYAMYHFRW